MLVNVSESDSVDEAVINVNKHLIRTHKGLLIHLFIT